MVKRSRQRRFARLRSEARGGDVEAQLALANRCCGSRGRRSDYRQARIWFEQAARAGSTEAMETLGLLHQRGLGGPKDLRRATRLLARAARLGNDSAAWILRYDYETGLRVRRNLRKAFDWSLFAAERGDAYEMIRAEELARQVKADCPPARVTSWLRRAAAGGDRHANYWLGHRLSEGKGVRRNPRAAYAAWRRAADLGDQGAWYMLGWSHELGEGVRASWPRALACYRAAARLGHDMACHELASYYERIEKNPRRRIAWLRKAALRGVAESQCELAIHLINGDGVRQDMAKAARLYRQSAEQGYGWAMQLLGRCYLEGDGVRRDRRAARRWFARAVEAGQQTDDRETVRVARSLLAEMRRMRGKA